MLHLPTEDLVLLFVIGDWLRRGPPACTVRNGRRLHVEHELSTIEEKKEGKLTERKSGLVRTIRAAGIRPRPSPNEYDPDGNVARLNDEDRSVGGHALVDVVEKLDVETQASPELLEHLDRVVRVGRRTSNAV